MSWFKKNHKTSAKEIEDGLPDDLDLGDLGGFDAFDSSKPRKPAMAKELAKGVFEGAAEQLKSPKFYSNAILPAGYRQAVEVADDTLASLSSLYNEGLKEAQPLIRDTQKLTKMVLPGVKKVLPKGLGKRLEEWAESGDEKRTAVPDAESAEIGMTLGAIFNAHAEAQAKQQIVSETRQAARDIVGKKQGTASLQTLIAIQKGVDNMVSYRDQITAQYQRKSLELGYRQFFALRKLVETSQQQLELSKRSFTDIVKNTGLPDFVKMQNKEFLQQALRTKFLGAMTEPMSQWFRGVGMRIINKGKTEMQTFFRDVGASLSDFVNAGEMLGNMGDMTGQTEGEMVANMVGSGIGGMLAGKFGEWAGPKIRAALEKNEKFNSTNFALLRLFQDAPMLLNKWAGSSTEQYGMVGGLINFLKQAVGTNKELANVHGSMEKHLDEQVLFDLQTRRTITDVIPGWLSKIHAELVHGRTGEAPSPEVYNWESARFETVDQHASKLREKVINKYDVKRSREDAETVYKALVPDGTKLSDKARRALLEYIINRGYNRQMIDVNQLTGFGGVGPEGFKGWNEVGDEISAHINSYFGRDGSKVPKPNSWPPQWSMIHGAFKPEAQEKLLKVSYAQNRFLGSVRTGKEQAVDNAKIYGPLIGEKAGVTAYNDKSKAYEMKGQELLDAILNSEDTEKHAGGGAVRGGHGLMSMLGGVKDFLKGGKVTGKGGPTEDKNLIAASPGEFMVKEGAVKQPGVLGLLHQINAMGGVTKRDKGGMATSKDAVENAIREMKDAVVAKLDKIEDAAIESFIVLDNLSKRPLLTIGMMDLPNINLKNMNLGWVEQGILATYSKGKSITKWAYEAGKEKLSQSKKLAGTGFDMGKHYGGKLFDWGMERLKETRIKMQDIVSEKGGEIKLYSWGIRNGIYTDVKSGKKVTSIADISGPVVDENGKEVVTQQDYDDGLFATLQGRIVGKLKMKYNALKQFYSDKYTFVKTKATNAFNTALGYIDMPFDVYVQGEDKPRIRATLFHAGGYFLENGNAVTRWQQVMQAKSNIFTKGPDGQPQLVLSLDEMSRCVDYKGRPIKSLQQRALDFVAKGWELAGKAKDFALNKLSQSKELAKKMWNGIKSPFSNMNGKLNIGYNVDNSGSMMGGDEMLGYARTQTDLLYDIRKILHYMADVSLPMMNPDVDPKIKKAMAQQTLDNALTTGESSANLGTPPTGRFAKIRAAFSKLKMPSFKWFSGLSKRVNNNVKQTNPQTTPSLWSKFTSAKYNSPLSWFKKHQTSGADFVGPMMPAGPGKESLFAKMGRRYDRYKSDKQDKLDLQHFADKIEAKKQELLGRKAEREESDRLDKEAMDRFTAKIDAKKQEIAGRPVKPKPHVSMGKQIKERLAEKEAELQARNKKGSRKDTKSSKGSALSDMTQEEKTQALKDKLSAAKVEAKEVKLIEKGKDTVPKTEAGWFARLYNVLSKRLPEKHELRHGSDEEQELAKEGKSKGIWGKFKDSYKEANAAQKDRSKKFTTSLIEKIPTILEGAGTLLSSVVTALGPLGRMAMGAGKLALGAGKLAVKGVGMAARGALAVGRFAVMDAIPAIAAALPGIMGAVASGAGAVAGTAAAIISSPIVLGAAVVGGALYGGYRLFKYLQSNKAPLAKFRFAQYGFNATDSDHVEKILELEKKVSEVTVGSKGKPAQFKSGLEFKDLIGIFGVSENNEDDVKRFMTWFIYRFKPVYLAHATVANDLAFTRDLSNIDFDVKNDKKIEFLKRVHVKDLKPNPYTVMASPFPHSTSLWQKTKSFFGGGDTSLDIGPKEVDRAFDFCMDLIKDQVKFGTKSPDKKGDGFFTNAWEAVKASAHSWVDSTVRQAEWLVDEGKKVADKVMSWVGTVGGWLKSKAKDMMPKSALDALMMLNPAYDVAKLVMGGDTVNKGLNQVTAAIGNSSAGKAIQSGVAAVGSAAASFGKGAAKWYNQNVAGLFDDIGSAAARWGVPVEYLKTMAMIESNGNPNAVSSTGATGVYQFTKETGKQYGLMGPGFDNRSDQKANIDAGAHFAHDNFVSLTKILGRQPEPWELYMAHNEGAGGLAALMNAARNNIDPSQVIVDKKKGTTLRANMDVNGGRGMSAQQFLDMWRNKYAAIASKVNGGPSIAAAPAAVAGAKPASTVVAQTAKASATAAKATLATPAVATTTPSSSAKPTLTAAPMATPVTAAPVATTSPAQKAAAIIDNTVASSKTANQVTAGQMEAKRTVEAARTSENLAGANDILQKHLDVSTNMDKTLSDMLDTMKRIEKAGGSLAMGGGQGQDIPSKAAPWAVNNVSTQSPPPPVSMARMA